MFYLEARASLSNGFARFRIKISAVELKYKLMD